MLPGPVFYVELIGVARRARYYWLRVLFCSILLFFLWTTYRQYVRYDYANIATGFSIQQLSQFGSAMFATIATVQGIAVVLLTPALVAGVIADEKERKTLHYLLASQLTSGEIVLGKLLARILTAAVFLALTLPIVSLLTLFGGVDPVVVCMVYLGTFTALFFLASLSILVSVYAKRPRDAIVQTYLVVFAWVMLPLFVAYVFALIWGPSLGVYQQILQVEGWVNPLSVATLFSTPFKGQSQVILDFLWRFALLSIWGLFFTFWATLRLRPVFRKTSDKVVVQKPKSFFGKLRRFRLLPPPVCGEDPMLWKEVFFRRSTLGGRIIGLMVWIPILCIVVYNTIWLGGKALIELEVNGYFGGYSPNGTSNAWGRDQYNGFVRAIITCGYIFSLLGIATAGATSVTSERERDTWTSLLATPLSSLEIFRGKLWGALASVRWIIIGMGVMFVSAVLLGAMHPLGVLLWGIEASVFFLFTASLSILFSMRARTSTRAMAQTIGLLALLNGGYMLCCFPFFTHGEPSTLILFACTPALQFFTLFSIGDWLYPPNHGNFDPYGPSLVGFFAYSFAAAALIRTIVNSFDATVDRPSRPEGAPESLRIVSRVKRKEADEVKIELDDVD